MDRPVSIWNVLIDATIVAGVALAAVLAVLDRDLFGTWFAAMWLGVAAVAGLIRYGL